ncbi:MAG: hypothetical protein OIF58_08975, partial [Cohaesibacter sp.]|nr:hypothetical protein [Cohaesibacter sp.]
MLAKTFSGNVLAIKWLLLEHFFKGFFSEEIKWSIDRFRDKMIEQNTDRKFSESFTRMHARVNTMIDASLFVLAKIVADSNSSFMRTTQATMLLFLNITKNADTWQNEMQMNHSSLIFFLVQIAEKSTFKIV